MNLEYFDTKGYILLTLLFLLFILFFFFFIENFLFVILDTRKINKVSLTSVTGINILIKCGEWRSNPVVFFTKNGLLFHNIGKHGNI